MVVLRMYYVQVFNHISVLFCSDRFIVNQKNCDTEVIFWAFWTLFHEGGGGLFDITVRPSSIRPSLYISSFVENIAKTNQYSGTNVYFLAQGNNGSLSLFQFVRYLIGTVASKVSTNTRLMRIRGHSELVMSLWRINTVSKR